MSHLNSLSTPWWRRERWRYALASFALGLAYSATFLLLGLEFRLGTTDVTFWVGFLIELSFAAFGFLWGLTVEMRRQERRTASEMEQRLRESSSLRLRLAHTEKLTSLGQLASTVAHEFRNPLAILRSMAQNLIEELPDEAALAKRSSHDMIEEIDRLARVTSKLVDYARPLTLEKCSVEAHAIARKVQNLGGEMLRTKKLRMSARGPRELSLKADPDLLCQVLLGLLANAIEASTENELIELAWHSEEPGWLMFELRDRGCGVAKEAREKIFEPFFTTRSDGHGLGLPVARQIVEAHGGRLEVGGEVGHGAVFTIRLPISETSV